MIQVLLRSSCRAAAQAGKSVLHLDPASSYGAHWASHRLDTFLDWAAAQQQRQEPSIRDSSSNGGDQRRSGQRSGNDGSGAGPQAAAADEIPVPAAGAGMYSHVSVWRDAGADLGAARDYNIDLAAKASSLLLAIAYGNTSARRPATFLSRHK